MDSDMIDTLTDYKEEDQKSIMKTLTAVQKNGWNHGQILYYLGKCYQRKRNPNKIT